MCDNLLMQSTERRNRDKFTPGVKVQSMTFDELVNLIVKAIADLFDTPQGQQLVKDLVAYIESVLAAQPPPPRPGATPQNVSRPLSGSASEPQNPTHR